MEMKERIEIWKLLAEELIKINSNVFIKDIHNNYYFCKIVLIGENKITIDCYAPEHRKGKRVYLNWFEIEDLAEEREE
ncbi:MAG: hypothetical protein QXG00_06445 [Candidatus Woesearchaeota archaeon]